MEATVTIRQTAALASVVALFTACSDPAGTTDLTSDVIRAADVVFTTPGDSPGPPFYAISANGGFIPHDNEWAAIPFLRQLACVPANVNLFDIVGPSAFGCTLTVSGHEHWENGPWADPAPRQTQFIGSGAVPIVFVRWSELQNAIADGTLGFSELLGLSTPNRYRRFYKETDIFGISGPLGAGRGMYKINARGSVGNRSFRLIVNEVLGSCKS
jgi:hypothetical protein